MAGLCEGGNEPPGSLKAKFKETLLQAMKQAGMETELRNTVFHWVRSHKNNDSINGYAIKEPLAYLRKAQMQWEKRIHKSLNSMCNEIGVPLARFRLASDRDELEEKWTELSTYDIDLSQYRPVYAPKDFLEVLLCIRSPNYRSMDGEGSWDFTQIPLKVKTLAELNDAETDHEEKKELVGSLGEKKLPTEGCSGRNGEREESSGQKKISDNRRY
ncbi:hypothetical protein ANN_04686 [Periplaneta americana]|uniref:Uncharacterized protein n=1 Tax=Periplaneta americana TaxID=6978 RepID=A0ABQ8T933_PERAM|nr:hypothetical protein ANN_04686 [Periplaneta americana]